MSEVIKDKIKKLIQKKNELAAEKRIQERKIENAGLVEKAKISIEIKQKESDLERIEKQIKSESIRLKETTSPEQSEFLIRKFEFISGANRDWTQEEAEEKANKVKEAWQAWNGNLNENSDQKWLKTNDYKEVQGIIDKIKRRASCADKTQAVVTTKITKTEPNPTHQIEASKDKARTKRLMESSEDRQKKAKVQVENIASKGKDRGAYVIKALIAIVMVTAVLYSQGPHIK